MRWTGWRRWWVAGLVALWAVLLVGAAVWSAHYDSATVRGQSELATGRQTLDRVVTVVTETVGPQVAVEVEPYRTSSGCRVTLARSGTEVDRTLVLTVEPGAEQSVLEQLAAGLPEGWETRYNANRNRLFADAGDFVAVRGEVRDPGQIRLTVSTGCRPGEDPALDSSPGGPSS